MSITHSRFKQIWREDSKRFFLSLLTLYSSTAKRYYAFVIASFRDKETERLWRTGRSRKLPATPQRVAFRKPAIINAAVELENLRVPTGNHLEALQGSRAGQHSIRVNDQYRICFRWQDGNAFEVEITDYH
jgi:proteic killer suppression protein